MNVRIGAGLVGLAVALSAPAMAHHSGAMFDDEKMVELTGTVVEFQYTNPHSWLIIEVEGEDGEKVRWGFEGEAPATMMRRGIGRNSIPTGTQVTMRGHPLRDGREGAAWVEAELPDGTVLKP